MYHTLRLSTLFVLVILLAACGQQLVPGSTGNETSSLCPEARSGLAVYWDWANGVFHPLDSIPAPGVGWTSFFHPDYPPLSFLHPPDWSSNPLRAQQSAGVEVIRGDNGAIWSWFQTWGDTSPGPRGYLDGFVDNLIGFFGAQGPIREICFNESQSSPAPGIAISNAIVALEVDGQTIMASVSITTTQGLPGGSIFFGSSAGPSAQFDRLTFDVFLPIHFQLFYGRTVEDSDGDGFPDTIDDFPFDPTRH